MADETLVAKSVNPFMTRAIALARKAGVCDTHTYTRMICGCKCVCKQVEDHTGGCFGAVIVKDGVIVGEGYNKVFTTFDPTHHAEVAAIRDATSKLQTFHLEDCDLYTSNEPCPMCLGACYWARLRTIYYSSTIGDAREYGNFDDDVFYTELTKAPAERSIPMHFSEESRPDSVKVWKEFQEDMVVHNIHYQSLM